MRYLLIILSLAGSALLLSSSLAFAQQSVATVQSDFVELRKGPGKAFPIFYVIEQGEKLALLRQQNEWVLVRSKDAVEGWLAIDDALSAVYEQSISLNRSVLGNKKVSIGGGWFDGSGEFGFGIGYRVGSRLTAALHLRRIVSGVATSNVLQPRLDLQAFKYARFNPLLSVGFGLMDNRPESSLVGAKNGNAQLLSYALGVRYFSSPALLVNVLAGASSVLGERSSRHLDIRIEWESAF